MGSYSQGALWNIGKTWQWIYKHRMALIVLLGIGTSGIILAGCTNHTLKDIYILALSYKAVDGSKTESSLAAGQVSAASNSSSLTVRVGFIGICASWISDDWRCSTREQTLEDIVLHASVQAVAGGGQQLDPLGVIGVAQSFRDDIVFSGLLCVSILFSVLSISLVATRPVWSEWKGQGDDGDIALRAHRLKSWFRKLPFARYLQGALFVNAFMAFISAFWQQLATSSAISMIQIMTASAVEGKIGSVATGLGWAVTLLGFLSLVIGTHIFGKM